MWDDLRRQLGFDDLSYEPGTWWCVPHHAVTHHESGPYPGEPFARKAAPGDGRPVVLGSAYGPNATLNLYRHITPTMQRDAADRLGAALFGGDVGSDAPPRKLPERAKPADR